MKKQMVKKVAIFTILSIFILACGMTCLAALPHQDDINWTYLNTCGYTFYMSDSTPTCDYITYGGSTTCGGKYAYVKVVMQQFKNGSWKNYATLEDEGYLVAGIEDEIDVDPGYTYRLKITHEARNSSGGAAIETHTHYSSNYIASLPRT